jgi:DNA polymerase-3 subunit delta
LKLDARQIAGFLRDPGPCRLVLLHGEDEGLIHERAQHLTRLVTGSLNDPFLVADLTRETWPQIPAEMAALSMIGGRRVIRVRDAADAILAPVAEAMKGPGNALLILEAPGLAKGKLRSFAEGQAQAAAIACYPEEGRALTDLIRTAFTEHRVSAEPDAIAWLGETLGGDRAVIRGEIEKLVLLAGPNGRLDLDMARAGTGDSAGAAGEDALSAAMAGNLAAADSAVEAAIADGLNGVALIRMALMHLQKMHQARLRMETGTSAADAVRAMRPPVFYKAIPAMTASLSLWPANALLRAIEEARQTELACKQTASRPELLVRRYLTWLTRQSDARKPRARA